MLTNDVNSSLSFAHDEEFTWSQISSLVSDRSPLVVLSACQTAVSFDYSTLSEQFGLPYAFLAAGASGVVASQWPVDDDATALLMVKFYELLLRGEAPPAGCLRLAQLWLRSAQLPDLMRLARGSTDIQAAARRRSNLSPTTPYADESLWGGFVLIGA